MRMLSFLLPLVVVLLFVPALRKVAPLVGLVDYPDSRKQHFAPTPVVGGIAMFLAFLLSSLTLGLLEQMPWGFFLGAAMVLALGMYDDIRPLGSKVRFVVQAGAALLAVASSGNLLTDLGQLIGPWTIALGVVALPFTVFGFVGIINAVNLTDGADGLAGGVAATALLWFGVVFALLRGDGAWPAGSVDYVQVMLALGGAVVGFLAYNLRTPLRKRASVFMGDAGSLFLGFVLGWFAIWAASQMGAHDLPAVAALWILVVPLFDTVACMLRRVLQGRSPMSPDRQHAHHMLQTMGLSHGQSVAVLIALNAIGGLIGVAGWRLGVPDYWMFASLAVLFVAHLSMVLKTWGFAPARRMGGSAGGVSGTSASTPTGSPRGTSRSATDPHQKPAASSAHHVAPRGPSTAQRGAAPLAKPAPEAGSRVAHLAMGKDER